MADPEDEGEESDAAVIVASLELFRMSAEAGDAE